MALNATFTADFSKWDASLKAAQAGLKSFEVAGKGAQAQLERMAKSFSGVEIKKQADVAVAAVHAIGGATKLTDAEQKKLNATLTEAIAKYRALGQQAPADMIALAKATEQVAKPTEQSGISIKGMIAAYVSGQAIWAAAKSAFTGIVQVLSDSIDAYAQAERAAKRLTVALRNQGDASPEVVASMSELASEFQRTTRFSDDLITDMQSLFVQLGNVGPKQMGLALTAATNLADGLGIELEQAVTAVSKALAGNGVALKKLVPSMDEAVIKGGDLAAIAGQINERFGGQSAAVLDTYAGRVEKLKNDWDNLQEAIGKAIVQDAALQAAMRALTTATNAAGDAQVELTASQIAARVAMESNNKTAGILIGLLDIWAAKANAAAEAQAFLNRTLKDTASGGLSGGGVASFLGNRGVPDIGKAGLAEWEKQNKLIDESEKVAKQAATAAKAAEKAYQEWAKAVTGVGSALAASQLEQRMQRLAKEGKLNQVAIAALLKEYEALRPALRELPNSLERMRTENQKALVPLENMQRHFQALAYKSIPDAVKMFDAGQSALAGLNRNGTLVSRTLVDISVAMKAVPFAQATKDVQKMAGEVLTLAKVLKKELTDALGDVSNIIIQGIIEGASAHDIAVAVGSRIGSALGKSIGFAIGGPLGAAVGEAIGSLAGPLIDALFKTRAERTVQRVAYEFGVEISEELAQGIEDQAKREFGGNRQASKIFSLDKIISEGGGLTAGNFQQLFSRFRDLFSMVQTGAFSAAEGIEVLDKNFKTFADFVTKGGSLASKELLEIIKLTDEFGLKSAEVSAFVVQETDKALGGLTTFLQNAQVKTQAAADGIGAALFGIFEAQTANGVPAAEIIKQLDPLIKNLDEQLKKAGLSGGAAFQQLKDLAAVASHEIAGPLITGVLGLEQALAGLHNAGVLNEEMFDGLTASVTDTYAQIRATGVDGNKALQLIAPTLQTMWELSEDFGYSVGEAEQALLDEAEAAGLVGEKHRTAQEQMLKLTQRMTVAIEGLARMFGVVLPDAVDDFGDALKDLPKDITIKGKVDWDVGEIPELPDNVNTGQLGQFYDNENRVPGFASGTPGLSFMNFGAGTNVRLHGNEAVIPYHMRGEAAAAWSKSGTEVVVIVLPHGATADEVFAAMPRRARQNPGQWGAKLAAELQKYGVR